MKVLILVGALVAVVAVVLFVTGGSPGAGALAAACGERGASWDAAENRCVFGMAQTDDNKQWCSEVRGTYDECIKSTCPPGLACPAVCVAACAF